LRVFLKFGKLQKNFKGAWPTLSGGVNPFLPSPGVCHNFPGVFVKKVLGGMAIHKILVKGFRPFPIPWHHSQPSLHVLMKFGKLKKI
jgi:hypothetical protein